MDDTWEKQLLENALCVVHNHIKQNQTDMQMIHSVDEASRWRVLGLKFEAILGYRNCWNDLAKFLWRLEDELETSKATKLNTHDIKGAIKCIEINYPEPEGQDLSYLST